MYLTVKGVQAAKCFIFYSFFLILFTMNFLANGIMAYELVICSHFIFYFFIFFFTTMISLN